MSHESAPKNLPDEDLLNSEAVRGLTGQFGPTEAVRIVQDGEPYIRSAQGSRAIDRSNPKPMREFFQKARERLDQERTEQPPQV